MFFPFPTIVGGSMRFEQAGTAFGIRMDRKGAAAQDAWQMQPNCGPRTQNRLDMQFREAHEKNQWIK